MTTELCTECGGLGCDACAFTGREYTPQRPAQYTPCVAPADHELAVAVARLAETGRVEPHFYRTNAVYHALAYRIHRGTPANDMVEGQPCGH